MSLEKVQELGDTVIVKYGGKKIALDPETNLDVDLIFVSHAHMDHLLRRPKRPIIASRETVEVAGVRGVRVDGFYESLDGISLIDSGHILGSRAIMFGDGDLLYTGDFAGRPRGFLKSLPPVHAKVLIMESTYGKAGYVFPPTGVVVEETMKLIAGAYDFGEGVSLHGYSLGKAQLLSYLFKSWRPLVINRRVYAINEVYRRHGVNLPTPDLVVDSQDEIKLKPFVYITHMSEHVEKAALNIRFTGWAKAVREQAMPLSDHADYNELIGFVKKVNPELVITVHGFKAELAAKLRSLGFNARPAGGYQKSLDEFQTY